MAIPGMLVDCVVVAGEATRYHPAFSGEFRVPPETVAPLPLDERTVIARRAATEIRAGSAVNLGIGLPADVGVVAGEERIADLMVLTLDPGVVGGIPAGGLDFGAAINAQTVIDHLDVRLHRRRRPGRGGPGHGQCDALGNVNVSRFGGRLMGCGASWHQPPGPARDLRGHVHRGRPGRRARGGRLRIVREGQHAKFVPAVEQVTFSGRVAATEDVLARLPFAPVVRDVRPMDAALFGPGLLGLRDRLLDIRIEDRISYNAETNTVFVDYAGMHVRTEEDLVE